MSRQFTVGCLCLLALLGSTFGVWADDGPDLAVHPVVGPKTVALGDRLADLELLGGFCFFNREDTFALLKGNGNPPSGEELGMVGSTQGKKQWLVVVRYVPCGHVSEDAGARLDPAPLLAALRTATADQNDDRVNGGYPPLTVDGWARPPQYTADDRLLSWAVTVSSSGGTSANSNVRLLGRQGVLSLNMVTEPSQLAADQKDLDTLVSHLHFASGQRFEDFVPGRDKAAPYGLSGLIHGAGSHHWGWWPSWRTWILILLVLAGAGMVPLLREPRGEAPAGEGNPPPEA